MNGLTDRKETDNREMATQNNDHENSSQSGRKKNGLPTGVIYSKKTGKYQATVRESCKDDEVGKKKKSVKLGFFDTPEEAYEVYKAHKMAEIIYIADCYKDVIPDKLYQAMINWKFDEI